MQTIDFELRTHFITLDALLKAAGVAPSGGAAKAMIAGGSVLIDEEVELRKTCKVRAGQVIHLLGVTIRVHAPTRPMPLA